MFIKTIVKTDKKTGKQYNYCRLCESYRIGDKVRHRTILNMGKLEGITTREDKKQLADLIESKIKGDKQLPLFDVQPAIEQYATEFSKRVIEEQLIDIDTNSGQSDTSPPGEKEYETVNINSFRHDDVREIGAEWLCTQTINQLGLKDFLTRRCGFSESLANLSLMHLVSRAVYPASEHKTAQWIKENSAVANLFETPLDKVNRFKLYSASNALYKEKVKIEDWLSHRTNELFDIHDKIVFYDLTNTYFEGRKVGSTLAKFGLSKEKRSDAKIVALAAVINAEGFLKYSRIYQGNIGDSTTLEQTINDLSLHTSTTGRKPVVVMDAGIISDENALMLKEKGYDYICVSRKKLKDYEQINPEEKNTRIHDKKGNPIELKLVTRPDDEDTYMYVHSQQKAVKERSMNDHFCQRYEEELDTIGAALHKKGGIKKYEKVWERIGRLKERYPTANKHYHVEVVPDQHQKNAVEIQWKRTPVKPKEGEGIYFIRTSLPDTYEETLWTIYNTLTEIEATFRVLKTDLSLRPVFHKNDDNIESHLFLGLLAYQVVASIRYQLKQKGIHYDWRNVVRIMNTQKEVTSLIETKNGKTIILKKCSTPKVEAKRIYNALNFEYNPYFMKKSVVPE